jgi:sporulation protein YlmC with PRC-barrel domain
VLLSVNDTLGYAIEATDGDVGKVSDVLFDDATSRVRYLVVDASGWLTDRHVLLPPAAFGTLLPDRRSLPTALTRRQVKDSPPLESRQPVSRQHEEALYRYYGWMPYWQGAVPGVTGIPYWGGGAVAPTPLADPIDREFADGEIACADDGLRSAGQVIGSYVQATDGDIGHVEDLLIDEHDWTIRYLVIDTRNWWPGKQVLVAPDWLVRVDWAGRQIAVDLTRDQIKASPAYDPSQPLDRNYQERLYAHYGRPPYWG